jgi:hypothetical protein
VYLGTPAARDGAGANLNPIVPIIDVAHRALLGACCGFCDSCWTSAVGQGVLCSEKSFPLHQTHDVAQYLLRDVSVRAEVSPQVNRVLSKHPDYANCRVFKTQDRAGKIKEEELL